MMKHRSPIWQFRLSYSFLIDLALQVKFVSKAPAWSHSGLSMNALQRVHLSVDRDGAGEGATLLELVSKGRQNAGQFFRGAASARSWGCACLEQAPRPWFLGSQSLAATQSMGLTHRYTFHISSCTRGQCVQRSQRPSSYHFLPWADLFDTLSPIFAHPTFR